MLAPAMLKSCGTLCHTTPQLSRHKRLHVASSSHLPVRRRASVASRRILLPTGKHWTYRASKHGLDCFVFFFDAVLDPVVHPREYLAAVMAGQPQSKNIFGPLRTAGAWFPGEHTSRPEFGCQADMHTATHSCILSPGGRRLCTDTGR